MGKLKKDVVAYCGLCCADCFVREGTVADLARDLRKELRRVRFDKFAEAISDISFFKALKKYPDCYEVLGVLVKTRCSKLCREGGGNPYCVVRTCCQKKGIEGCWECSEFIDCKKLKVLERGHGVAHIRNLRRLKRNGVKEFLEGKRDWYVKPPAKK